VSPYILLQSSRPSTLFSSTPSSSTTLPYYPLGTTEISPSTNEICGSNAERQDSIITPTSIKLAAEGFRGYFCARFDVQFNGGYGVIQGPGDNERPQTERREGALSGNGTDLAAYARFAPPNAKKNEFVITIRVGTSFISTTQARANIDAEIPDGRSIEETTRETEEKWLEKLGRFEVEGGSEDDKTVFWTGMFHALQVSEHPSSLPFPFCSLSTIYLSCFMLTIFYGIFVLVSL
jgi:hypothetical protein